MNLKKLRKEELEEKIGAAISRINSGNANIEKTISWLDSLFNEFSRRPEVKYREKLSMCERLKEQLRQWTGKHLQHGEKLHYLTESVYRTETSIRIKQVNAVGRKMHTRTTPRKKDSRKFRLR